MRCLPIAATLLGAAFLATATSALAATPNPCVLVTADNAGDALGSIPAQSKPKTVGLYRSCTYTVKKKRLTVQTRHVATKSAFEKSAHATGLVFAIHGVGAEAFSADGGKALLAWKNGTEVTLTFGGFNPFVATQQSLAKTALGRL